MEAGSYMEQHGSQKLVARHIKFADCQPWTDMGRVAFQGTPTRNDETHLHLSLNTQLTYRVVTQSPNIIVVALV